MSYYPGMEEEEADEDDLQHLDIEDRKILSKRKKKIGKIEDCYVDLDQFFELKKRFKPSSPDSTFESEKQMKPIETGKLKIKMLENYL